MGSEKRRIGRWAAGFTLGVLFTFGVVAYNVIDIFPAARNLDQEVAQYRANKMPWVASDLDPADKASGDNAAPYLQAAALGVDWGEMQSQQFNIGEELDKGDIASADYQLSPYSSAIQAAIAASRRPVLNLHKDWDFGPGLTFQEDAPIRNVVRCLGLDAQEKMDKRDVADAATDLLAARKIASLLAQQPTIIASLISVAADEGTTTAVERCAAKVANDPSALKQLASVLDASVPVPNYAHALRGEAYLQIALERNASMRRLGMTQDGPISTAYGPPVNLNRVGLPPDLVGRALMGTSLKLWNAISDEIRREPNDPMAQGRFFDKLVTDMGSKKSFTSYLMSFMQPTFAETSVAIVSSEADLVSKRCLLHAMIERAEGHPVEKLSDVPGSWIDPFTKQPLKLVSGPGRLVVYSVGPDLQDNGGMRRALLKSQDTSTGYDIVASYPPLARSSNISDGW